MRSFKFVTAVSALLLIGGCQGGKSNTDTAPVSSAAQPGDSATAHRGTENRHATNGSNGDAPRSLERDQTGGESKEHSAEYLDHLENTRRLMQLAAAENHAAKAVELFRDLLDEIQREEGRIVSMQTAFSEACNFERHRQFDTAIAAFELFQERYVGEKAVPDAIVRAGTCKIEQAKYADAERDFRRVIEEHGDSNAAEPAWRKLSLALLLEGRYDDSLTTLKQMDERYKGTHLSEYARVRQAYVLVAANRLEDGKAQYARFLKECSGSKYCRFAKRELALLK